MNPSAMHLKVNPSYSKIEKTITLRFQVAIEELLTLQIVKRTKRNEECNVSVLILISMLILPRLQRQPISTQDLTASAALAPRQAREARCPTHPSIQPLSRLYCAKFRLVFPVLPNNTMTHNPSLPISRLDLERKGQSAFWEFRL